MALLEVRKVTKDFGGLRVLTNVDLDINQGEILGLIGPNGAGKTTLFNIISGFCRPTSGSITYDGRSIVGLKPNQIAAMGIIRTFQVTTLFKSFTVMENVQAASYLKARVGFFEALLNTASCKRKEGAVKGKAREVLKFVDILHLSDHVANSLPYGFQRTLSFASALAIEPKMLLLDEPVCALNPQVVQNILSLIRRIRASGTTVLMIEHNPKVMFDLCDRIAVLSNGAKIADGPPSQIREDKNVIAAYLRAKRHAAES